jgi:hypothetical protein
MSRRLVPVLSMCIAAGFILNLAVSWSLGWRPQASTECGSFGLQTAGGLCGVTWQHDFGRESIEVMRPPGGTLSHDMRSVSAAFEAGFSKPLGVPHPVLPQGTNADTWIQRLFSDRSAWAYSATTPLEYRTVTATGWPLRSFIGYESWLASAPAARTSKGFLLRDQATALRGVAWMPLPLGLAVNTLVFTIPALVVAVMLPRLRSRLRVRRGHCPTCRYDLRGNFATGCPECGWNRPAASANTADELSSDRKLA